MAVINPSLLSGTAKAPASKSVMQRACALALLNRGTTQMVNPGNSNDDQAALNIIQELGATVKETTSGLIINSSGKIRSSKNIQCGESGLSARMFTPIAALASGESIIHGSGTLLKRPFHFFDDFFSQLQLPFHSSNGYLPLSLTGPIVPHDLHIDASTSSQYLTGILFAFARSAKKHVTITVSNLVSKPYIDLSIAMMKDFGYVVEHDVYTTFSISPYHDTERYITCHIESDWSSAAMLLVAAAISGGNVEITGLDISSKQADVRILEVLEMAGVPIRKSDHAIFIRGGELLKPFMVDAGDCPDLFPPLVALATACQGKCLIRGVSRLAGKESDRGKTLTESFVRLGVDIFVDQDDMAIMGGKGISGGRVSSFDDHRIAMSVTIAALKGHGTVYIDNAEAVNKSFPGFYEQLQSLGANILLHHS